MMKLVTIEEIQEAAKRPSREETAGCANRLTLHFLTPLLAKGSDITLRDMGRPIPSDQAANVSQRFRKAWDPLADKAMKNGGTPDLFGAQLRSLDGGYLRFFTALLCYFIEGVLQLVPAVCLNILVKHFEGRGNLSMRAQWFICLLYTSPSPRDATLSRMPSSA